MRHEQINLIWRGHDVTYQEATSEATAELRRLVTDDSAYEVTVQVDVDVQTIRTNGGTTLGAQRDVTVYLTARLWKCPDCGHDYHYGIRCQVGAAEAGVAQCPCTG